MSAFSLASPGFITIHEEGMFFSTETYAIGVLGPRRILHTAEFVQSGQGEGGAHAMQVGLVGRPVPENARIFAAGSGISPGNTHQFWVGWLVGRHVHMQALMQEKPIEAELAADETPIFPAITDGSGAVSLYTWRPAPGGGTALWRHTFKGAIKTAGTASAEALSEIPGRPVVSVVGAIPGERAAHALIGWVESGSEGAVLGIAVDHADAHARGAVEAAARPGRLREPTPGHLGGGEDRGRDNISWQRWCNRAPAHPLTIWRSSTSAETPARAASTSTLPIPFRERYMPAAFDYERNHTQAILRPRLPDQGRNPVVRHEAPHDQTARRRSR